MSPGVQDQSEQHTKIPSQNKQINKSMLLFSSCKILPSHNSTSTGKLDFYTLGQSNQTNSCRKLCQCQTFAQDVSHWSSHLLLEHHRVVTSPAQEIHFTGLNCGSSPRDSSSFTDPILLIVSDEGFGHSKGQQSYEELNSTEFCTWCVSQNS